MHARSNTARSNTGRNAAILSGSKCVGEKTPAWSLLAKVRLCKQRKRATKVRWDQTSARLH
jgi:hypothetical protein